MKITIKRRNCTQYLWTWRQSVVPNDAPRDFGPEVAFGAKFQISVARQWGREMSAPRPYETDPFHSLGSVFHMKQYIYNISIYLRLYEFLLPCGTHKWVYMTLRMCTCRNPQVTVQVIKFEEIRWQRFLKKQYQDLKSQSRLSSFSLFCF